MGTSKYTAEFRADAVALYRASPGRAYAAVVKDLGVIHETLRVWVRQAEQAAVPRAAETNAGLGAAEAFDDYGDVVVAMSPVDGLPRRCRRARVASWLANGVTAST